MLMIVITTNQLLGRKFIAKIIRPKDDSFGVHIEAIRMFWPREKQANLICWIFLMSRIRIQISSSPHLLLLFFKKKVKWRNNFIDIPPGG